MKYQSSFCFNFINKETYLKNRAENLLVKLLIVGELVFCKSLLHGLMKVLLHWCKKMIICQHTIPFHPCIARLIGIWNIFSSFHSLMCWNCTSAPSHLHHLLKPWDLSESFVVMMGQQNYYQMPHRRLSYMLGNRYLTQGASAFA